MNRRPQTFKIFRGVDQARRRSQSDVSALHSATVQPRSARADKAAAASAPQPVSVAAKPETRALVSLSQAEVIVVGVPRVGKAPVCEFLARHGLKAAPLHLAARQTIPENLKTRTQALIVALTMRPDRLIAQRRLRPGPHGNADVDIDLEAVRQEIADARQQYAAMGWTSIDVTHNTPASTAARIVALWQRRQAKPE